MHTCAIIASRMTRIQSSDYLEHWSYCEYVESYNLLHHRSYIKQIPECCQWQMYKSTLILRTLLSELLPAPCLCSSQWESVCCAWPHASWSWKKCGLTSCYRCLSSVIYWGLVDKALWKSSLSSHLSQLIINLLSPGALSTPFSPAPRCTPILCAPGIGSGGT